MPFIIIRGGKMNVPPSLEGIAKDLSETLGIDMKRINILAEYFDVENQFTGMKPDKLIIAVYVSETNGNLFISTLMETIASLAENHFSKPKGSAEVMCNLIGSGHLFANQKFI